MYRTFNCGIGFVLVLSAENASQAIELLKEQGEEVYKIGKVRLRETAQAQTIIK